MILAVMERTEKEKPEEDVSQERCPVASPPTPPNSR